MDRCIIFSLFIQSRFFTNLSCYITQIRCKSSDFRRRDHFLLNLFFVTVVVFYVDPVPLKRSVWNLLSGVGGSLNVSSYPNGYLLSVGSSFLVAFSCFLRMLYSKVILNLYIYPLMKTVRFTLVGGYVSFLLPTSFSPQCGLSRC